MLITYKKWIEKLNQKLMEFQQTILVVEYTRQSLTLSNRVVLVENEFQKFKKRILNKKTNEWVKNSDRLIKGEITEFDIKSIICSKGGISCQMKYGDKIKKNLNTGIPWNKDKKGIPGKPHTEETKLKISNKNRGENNGMYGKKMTPDRKKQHSDLMKQLIFDGKFTPCSNNRNTHWDSYFNGKKYRSSWEALYQYFDADANYEELRIPYSINNIVKVYIVDFINHNTKTCIEIKPKELCNDEKFNAKLHALNDWGKTNGYNILVIGKEWFKQKNAIIDFTNFDLNTQKKIKDLLK